MPNAKLPVKSQKPFKIIARRDNVTEYELIANGLRVILVPILGSETVTTNLVYHVGSQHEAQGQSGLAHMLEHMLFKPTRTEGLAWKKLENVGAVLNASTWLDRTNYYFHLPKIYLDQMLAVEADRMRNVQLDDAEFKPEQANVLSEYEMYNSQPEIALDWNLVATAFQAHGYKHDTIGWRGDIEAFTTLSLADFYNRHYWPDQATLIIAGGFNQRTTLTSIFKHFGLIPRSSSGRPMPAVVEPVQEGIRRLTLERETPLRLFVCAFKAPSFSHSDWTTLNLALNHLTLGETSVLYERLVSKKLATSVEAHLFPTLDPYLATISISTTEKASYDTIERIVMEAVRELRDTPLATRTLNVLKMYDYTHELVGRDGDLAVASQLGEYVASGNWQRYFDRLIEINAVTPKAVKQVAEMYLRPSQATIATLSKPS